LLGALDNTLLKPASTTKWTPALGEEAALALACIVLKFSAVLGIAHPMRTTKVAAMADEDAMIVGAA
jgi:hypothetical protein